MEEEMLTYDVLQAQVFSDNGQTGIVVLYEKANATPGIYRIMSYELSRVTFYSSDVYIPQISLKPLGGSTPGMELVSAQLERSRL